MFGINIENFKQNKISYIFKKGLRFSFFFFAVSVVVNMKKIFKEE